MAGRKLRRLKAGAVLVRDRGHRGSGQRTQLRSQQFVVGRHNRCAELQLRSCAELSCENRETHIMPFKVQVGPPQIAIHQGQTVLVSEPDGRINWPGDNAVLSGVHMLADGDRTGRLGR